MALLPSSATKKVAGGIHGNPGGFGKSGRWHWRHVLAAGLAGGSGDGGDDPVGAGGGELADGAAVLVCHVDFTGAVHGRIGRQGRSGPGGHARVGGDDPVGAERGDFTDGVVALVGNKEVGRHCPKATPVGLRSWALVLVPSRKPRVPPTMVLKVKLWAERDRGSSQPDQRHADRRTALVFIMAGN